MKKGLRMGGGVFGLREENELLIHHSRKKKTTNSVYVGRQPPMVGMPRGSFLEVSLILVI